VRTGRSGPLYPRDGQAAQARVLLRQALKILQRIGAVEADVVRELTTFTEAGPPA
jgi:hypothetical protein